MEEEIKLNFCRACNNEIKNGSKYCNHQCQRDFYRKKKPPKYKKEAMRGNPTWHCDRCGFIEKLPFDPTSGARNRLRFDNLIRDHHAKCKRVE
jgi:hypothetical protein